MSDCVAGWDGASDIPCPVGANSWCFDGVWVVKRGVIAGVMCRVARRDRVRRLGVNLDDTDLESTCERAVPRVRGRAAMPSSERNS
jgi:hypothetical protein